jgi:ferritin
MVSKEMEKQLNLQINKELYSAYYYLAMAAYCENNYLSGFAKFFQIQATEEVGHANKFYKYLNEQGGRVVLDAIEKPPTDYKDVEEIFQLGLDHEKFVTKSIYGLVALADKENDYATKSFLNWFVNEQVEEEATMDTMLNKIRMAGKEGTALFMLDARAGTREDED